MRPATLIERNLTYYWRTNLAVVLGVATATAVLGGALLVGDSVRASLRDLFLARLGKTDYVVSGPGFFRERLADDLRVTACPLIALEGLVVHERDGRRASGVQVYGVDARFWKFHGRAGAPPSGRELLMSRALAEELGAAAGDAVLVRIEKPAAIPLESLHGRKDDLGRSMRFSTRDVLPASAEFSARPQQGEVRAVFVPLRRLQSDLKQEGRVNTILVSGRAPALKDAFALEDLGIKLRRLEERHALSLESDSGLINDALAEAARATAERMGLRVSPILTYLANAIRARDSRREIPYSLATAMDLESLGARNDGIVLNDWAARDLGVRPGDTITLEYYVWQEGGRLLSRSADFPLSAVVPLKGAAADRDLAPEYPGITESASFDEWDPPFPIDLKRVRPRDEQYWEQHRTTPKAFLPLAKGQELWPSRFGKLTSVRILLSERSDPESYRTNLKAALDPAQVGLAVYPARAEGLEAARGATDFGEYFVYFSFFLVVSAVLLAGLFFKLGVEQRLKEIGILRSAGFPAAMIRKLFLSEGIVLAAAGSVVGLAGAIAYGGLMMLGLRTWWVDAVGTRYLHLHVAAPSLALGAVGGVIAALVSIIWTLRGLGPVTPRGLMAGTTSHRDTETRRRMFLSLSVALCLGGLGMLLAAWRGWIGQVGGFFGAGILLLAAFLGFLWVWLSGGRGKLLGSVTRLGFRNATYRPGRSILSIALIASATFIIVAVHAFRHEGQPPQDRKSGTGGYPLMAESLLPLPYDPNTDSGRENLNLAGPLEGVRFDLFRLRPGDDSSCLNLYQPRNPRILGASGAFLGSNRFSFQESLAQAADREDNPWMLLESEPGDGVVPAITDANSMTYVLHRKLGEELVVQRDTGPPARLRLVAALKDSLFQSEIVISEKNFLRLFPEEGGYRFFLIDVASPKAAEVTSFLEQALSDYGFDVVPAGERLARFHRVENTYLSTFQTLGGLGLVLGTAGLAAVLLRNVLERRRELALLRAVGYRSVNLAVMVIAENALLLACGLVAGTASALLAIAPAFLARGGQAPTGSLGLLLAAVLVTGLAASLLAVATVLRSPLLATLRSE